MKKLVYVLLAFILIACSQSNEARIESAFMEYAENNFDDPTSIMKVVSVDIKDTIDILNMAKEVKAWDDSLDNVKNSNADSIIQLVNLYGKKLSGSMEFKQLWSRYLDELEKSKDNLLATAYRLLAINEKKSIDSLLKSEMPKTISFDVKYRMKVNGQPKLNVLSGYSDLSLSNIIFQNSSVKNSTYEVLGELIELYSKKIENTSNLIKLQNSLFEEINKHK